MNRREMLVSAGVSATLPGALAASPAPSVAPAAAAAAVDETGRALRRSGPKIAPYLASCVQSRIHPSFTSAGSFVPEACAANLNEIVAMLDRGRAEIDARLYCFSEFALQMALTRASVQDWLRVAISVPGPETDRIAAAAQRAGAHVAINVVEKIAAFPERYFLSGLVFSPSGEIVLNYRKLYDISNKTRPTDVYTRWIELFGEGSLFPVVDTAIGRLGCAIGLDVNWPEMIRSLIFNGMELLLNPTASPAFTRQTPDIGLMTRRVRAFENAAYVMMTNIGPVHGARASNYPILPSEIIDYEGVPLASAADALEGFVTANVDIDRLRRARTSLAGSTPLIGGAPFAQLQPALHLPGYERNHLSPIGQFAARPIQEASEHDAGLMSVIAHLAARGVLKAPGL